LRFLDRLQPFALLALRVVSGIILIAHGKGKVFGGFGRHMAMVSGLGLPGWTAYLSTTTEFFGGMFLIAGLLTRLVGLAVCCEMIIAIWKVHWSKGLVGQGGYEFPLLLGTAGFLLIFFGAGPLSLDHSLWRRKLGGGAPRKT